MSKKIQDALKSVVALLLFTVVVTVTVKLFTGQSVSTDEDAKAGQPMPSRKHVPAVYDGEPNRKIPEHVASDQWPDLPEDATESQIADSRVFPTRLFPISLIGGEGEVAENKAVAELLSQLRELSQKERYAQLEKWLDSNSHSRWASAFKNELYGYRHERGYFKQARVGWQGLWDQLKSVKDLNAIQLGNEVLSHLLDTNVSIARAGELRKLLIETEGRLLGGALEGKIFRAREAIYLLEHTGAQSVLCGPLALNSVTGYLGKPITPPILAKITPDYIGTGLPLNELSNFATNNYRIETIMARRDSVKEAMPTPSVMHLSDEHYIALLQKSEDGSEYFIEDKTLSFAGWVDKEALEEAASGYFLVAQNELPSGYSEVLVAEARKVFGRDGAHGVTSTSETVTDDDCQKGGDKGDCKGMPRFSFHPLPGAVRINDIPIGYTPPVGPAVAFRITYNDLDNSSPTSAPPFSNVGLTWNTDWVAWVKHQSGSITAGSVVKNHLPGGGAASAKWELDDGVLKSKPDPKSFSQLQRSNTYTYTRSFKDGSKQIYDTPDTLTGTPVKIFLSQKVDANGNALTYGYDNEARLISVTDAIGQVTTLQYDLASDTKKITSVTDPFNRTASLEYDAQGLLVSVTDMIGLTSTFTYTSAGFISTINTPYGTTSFKKSGDVSSSESHRWIEATDPQGDTERIEFVDTNKGVLVNPINMPPSSVAVKATAYIPVGGETVPSTGLRETVPSTGLKVPFINGAYGMKYRNTFYWSKKAWRHSPNDYSAAEVLHWYTSTNGDVVPYVEASKKAKEDWVWYSYRGRTGEKQYWDPAGSTSTTSNPNIDPYAGSRPTKVLQMRADGTPRLVQTLYNDQGNATLTIDPEGRATEYIYYTNGVDLKEVRQRTGGINDLLLSATYNTSHQPLTVTDAAGRVSTFTYNTKGQILTSQNHLSETTTYIYDTDGYLQSVDGPLAGTTDTTTFGYDSKGRMDTVTSPDGYTVTALYDNFDRITKVTFPDSTYTENSYERLSLASSRDRTGKVTRYAYNALRQLVQTTDPLNRVTSYEWCRCGDLRKLTDALGKVTQWKHDVQARKTKKIYPDNTEESYTYDPSTGELTGVTGRNGQQSNFVYNLDGSIASTSHSSTDANVPAAAGISMTYDDSYGRLKTMTDQIGTTTYGYHPFALNQNGAGAIATVDGPWANDTITYGYDNLGRLKDHQIDGVSFGTNLTYDSLGRLTDATNALGTFTNTFDGVTSRITNVAYPNGMNVAMNYGTAAQDFRLQEIHNKLPGGATASKFNFTHDVNGQITSLTRQLATGTTSFAYGYDRTYQLTSALLSQAGNPSKHYSYSYDLSGNRTSKQVDSTIFTASHNSLNQLTGLAGGGATRFYGTVDEPSLVTVDGKAASVDTNNNFETFLDLAPGNHDVTIQATDGQGNPSSKTYTVTIPAQSPEGFTYDPSGNMETHTADGKTRLYQWDSLNRLISIQSDQIPVSGSWRTEFTYNGSSQRVARKEYSNNGTSWIAGESVTYLWAGGNQPAQLRDATGATVTRHYLGSGFAEPDGLGGLNKYYTTKDHLGSTREIINGSTNQIETVYDYSPYGEVEVIQSTAANIRADMLYTGHYYHGQSELYLTLFRAYDPGLGRWLSPDPIKENGGLNLYAYVTGDPINYLDFLGLQGCPTDPSESPDRYTKDNVVNMGGLPSELKKHWRMLWNSGESAHPDQKVTKVGINPNFVPGGSSRNAVKAIWTSTKKVSSVRNAFRHWKDHGKDFPHLKNAKQYVDAAKTFCKNPPKGTLTKTRVNGDKLFYDPKTNTFAVQNVNGILRTMFKPKALINYWNKQ